MATTGNEIVASTAEDSVIDMKDHEIDASAPGDSVIHMEDKEIEATPAEDSVIHMEDYEIEASTAKDSAINMEDHEIEASAAEDTGIHMEDYEIDATAAEDHIPNVDALLRQRNRDYWESLRNKLVRRVKIPRVPKRLRGGEDDAYEPKIISFGPYHRGLDRLKDMEEHKERYLQTILLRCRCLRDELKNKIKELEGDVRRCYSDNIGGLEEENGEFLNMMMLDGCFIVEYFIKRHQGIGDAELHNMMNAVRTLVRYDMIFLLENQLPFFLLEHIFNHVKKHQPQLSQFTFMDLCITYIERNCKVKVNFPHPNPDHLLHLYYSTFRVNSTNANAENDDTGTKTGQGRKENAICDPLKKIATIAKEKVRRVNADMKKVRRVNADMKKIATTAKEMVRTVNAANTSAETKQREETRPRRIPSATVLHEHGITFKKNETEGSSIIDIKFHKGKGVLEIPPLNIGDSTNSQFRNLIAFEQLSLKSNVRSQLNFLTYVTFLDFIINTPEDVSLLCREGILEHYLGSDKDVADLFNNLTFGTFLSAHDYLSKLKKDMNEYQKLFWPRWRANLMRNYFNTPWAGLSVAAAVFLLVAAISQTVFTGISTF